MGEARSSSGSQVNRLAANVSTKLKQLASNPPELSVYLKTHSNCVEAMLKPRGLSYEILNGSGLKRVYGTRFEDLNLRDNPLQDAAFKNASKAAQNQKRVQILQPFSNPSGSRDNLKNDSSVVEKTVEVFNETPYQQFFVPVVLDGKSAGVLHVWFDPANQATTQGRQRMLIGLCEELSAYLRNRRSVDLSNEVTRLNTYSHLLEDLAGDIDLESVSWSLVNFARETVECERVSIFSVKDYPSENLGMPEFELLACSGLKRPHPRSEQAEILKGAVRELGKVTLQTEETPKLPAKVSVDENSSELPKLPAADAAETDGPKDDEEKAAREESETKEPEEQKAPAMPRGSRPQFRLIFTYRDPSKKKDRPDALNTYFDLIPMNWATTLPLFDRNGMLCGILLFEGQESADKAQKTFLPMRDLAYSGGRAIGTALYWNNRRSLRLAKGVEGFKQRVNKTPPRRIFLKVGIPVLAVIGLLLMPINFKVRGNATLRPQVAQTLPAAVPERLAEVHVREGQRVEEGQLLAELDTSEQELMLQQLNQDRMQFLAESDMARDAGNEVQMRIASLRAEGAATEVERLRREIELAKIAAPFDGVVTGPLNIRQRKGQVFRLGEPVIELARLENWEVRIDVREQDIVFLNRELSDHQSVRVRVKFNADPTTEHGLEVSDQGELSYGLETQQGVYAFAVVLPMELPEGSAEKFRVGYSGNAIFELGRRPLGYVFFRDFIHFIKLRWF